MTGTFSEEPPRLVCPWDARCQRKLGCHFRNDIGGGTRSDRSHLTEREKENLMWGLPVRLFSFIILRVSYLFKVVILYLCLFLSPYLSSSGGEVVVLDARPVLSLAGITIPSEELYGEAAG